MTSADQIVAAIQSMEAGERNAVLRRLQFLPDADGNHGYVDERGDDAWDRQMTADAAAGKFDKLIAEADADLAAGRCRPLP